MKVNNPVCAKQILLNKCRYLFKNARYVQFQNEFLPDGRTHIYSIHKLPINKEFIIDEMVGDYSVYCNDVLVYINKEFANILEYYSEEELALIN